MPITEPTETNYTAAGPVDPQEKYAASTWGGGGVDLRMPSGQLAFVKKPGLTQLIGAGVIDSLDTLSSIAGGLIDKAEGKKSINVDELMSDPSKITSMLHLIDRVTCFTVIKPEVVMTPNDVTRRKQGVIYADMVDMEDKFFIFKYLTGGSTDLEQFRRESKEALGSLDIVSEDADTAV